MDQHRERINPTSKQENKLVKIARRALAKLNIEENGSYIGIMMLLVAVLSLIAGVLIANYIVMPSMISYGKEIVVPDVTGMAANEARNELEPMGLDLRIVEEKYSDSVDMGYIISQNPLPNARVKFNKSIEVSVSKGIESQVIPSVRNMYAKDAVDLLIKEGFIVNDTVEDFAEEIDKGMVINTDPPSGTIYSKGKPITLILSIGKKENYSVLPKFTGMNADSAIMTVMKMNLVIGKTDTIKGDVDYPVIYRQIPDSGAFVEKNDTVNFVIKIPEF